MVYTGFNRIPENLTDARVEYFKWTFKNTLWKFDILTFIFEIWLLYPAET